MSFSLMNDQMMRVISSPSSSTTGFATLIFGMAVTLVASFDGTTGEPSSWPTTRTHLVRTVVDMGTNLYGRYDELVIEFRGWDRLRSRRSEVRINVDDVWSVRAAEPDVLVIEP